MRINEYSVINGYTNTTNYEKFQASKLAVSTRQSNHNNSQQGPHVPNIPKAPSSPLRAPFGNNEFGNIYNIIIIHLQK